MNTRSTCYVKVKIVIQHSNGVDMNYLLNEMDYEFKFEEGIGAKVIDTEIIDQEVPEDPDNA
jgi:hypothetical protein